MGTQSARSGDGPVRVTATVRGYVQGVGFRWSTLSVAEELRLVGIAENQYNGDVLVIAEGSHTACEQLVAWLRGDRSRSVRRPGRVDAVTVTWGPATGEYRRFLPR